MLPVTHKINKLFKLTIILRYACNRRTVITIFRVARMNAPPAESGIHVGVISLSASPRNGGRLSQYS